VISGDILGRCKNSETRTENCTYRSAAREFSQPSLEWQLSTGKLVSDAQGCRLCPRMLSSRRVLSDLNGPWEARIMFVAEAPGRLGAEKTGIPLFGDRTGDRFEELLQAMHWQRCDVFVTNAILCNPRDCNGNNGSPTSTEISNCSSFLRRTIDLVNPVVVISLGRVSLRALALVCEHHLQLRTSVGKLVHWYERRLGVLYHPGPRTAVHRPWREQLQDAQTVAQTAAPHLLAGGSSLHKALYD
jgi:uracil-DNA glycosylase